MKTILTYEFTEEGEALQKIKDMEQGGLWQSVLWTLEQHLREEAKYRDKETINIEDLKQKIYNLMNENDLEFSP